MANTQKAEVTEAEIKHAQDLWIDFTKLLKIGTIGVIALVILLALVAY